MIILMKHKQVDMKNLTEQLQTVYTPFIFNIEQNFEKYIEIPLSQNDYVNKEDAVGFLASEPDPINFLTPEPFKQVVKPGATADMWVIVTLSNKKYLYERSVYTFFSLIGDIGGFNGAIVILPTFIMSIYSDRMYKNAISGEVPVRKRKKR